MGGRKTVNLYPHIFSTATSSMLQMREGDEWKFNPGAKARGAVWLETQVKVVKAEVYIPTALHPQILIFNNIGI